jgi:hypothetical protein
MKSDLMTGNMNSDEEQRTVKKLAKYILVYI